MFTYHPLALSAHVFLINTIYSLLEKHYTYSILAFNLYISSVYWHQYRTHIGFWYDQSSLYSLVSISLYYNIIYDQPYRLPYALIMEISYFYTLPYKNILLWHITVHLLGSVANIVTQAGIITSSSQGMVNR